MKLNQIFFIALFSLLAISFGYAHFGIKEMDNLKVWKNAYNDLNTRESYTVQEDIELKYTLNNKEYKRIDRTIISLQLAPFIQKNVFLTVNEGYVNQIPEQTYYLEEGNSIYYLQTINGTKVKNEIDQNSFYNDDEENTYHFIFNHIPINMVRDEENKYQYTYTFKLSQYQPQYHSIFDELVAELSEEFKTKNEVNILDQDLVLTIQFNEKYQYTSVSLDASNILKDIIDDTYANLINNYSLVYTYTFTNFDQVVIQETEYNDAVYDDAPNELNDLLIYPEYKTVVPNSGTFEYGKDIDIFTISVKNNIKYEFKIDTTANINFYILNEDGQLVIYESFIQNSSYVYNLLRGDYWIYIESEDLDTATYEIDTVLKTDNAETVLNK